MNHDSAAVTEDMVRSWFFQETFERNGTRYQVSTHRNLSLMFELEDKEHQREVEQKQNTKLTNDIAAMCIILPLNERGFRKLMNSQVFETTTDPLTDFFRAERFDLSEPNSERVNRGDTKSVYPFFVLFFFVLPDLQFLIRSFSLFHHALTHSHSLTHSLTHTHTRS